MKRLPRILKIIEVKFPSIICAFNNAEYRRINVAKLFDKLGIKEGDFGYQILKSQELFNSVSLNNNTLAWKELKDVIKISGKQQVEVFFHLDPIVVYKNSTIDKKLTYQFDLGHIIRKIRKRLKLSQETLAKSIGSNKQYISKIENNKADLEFKTIKKIFELGLDRNIFISHYEKHDLFRTYANSILTNEFLEWASRRKNELTLIEGIGERVMEYLEEANIKTTEELSAIEFPILIQILSAKKSIRFFHHPELWVIQAKYISSNNWMNVINLQRTISSKNTRVYSKIEVIAKREIRNNIFEVY